MKIAFISNYLNHHQLPVSLELAKNNEYYFIVSETISKERLELGYEDMNDKYDFVIKLYQDDKQVLMAQKIIDTADVVIAGSCCFPFKMLEQRLKADKLTFWFSERLFKVSPLVCFYPPTVRRVLEQCTKYNKNKNFYLLCAGGFVAKDYLFFHAFKNKTFKWGYIPKTDEKDITSIMKSRLNSTKIRLFWAGRFIAWKHVDYAITIAERLVKMQIDFELKIAGSGELFDKIKKMVESKKLGNVVKLLGATPANQVRELMDKADIFLFTSDRREGWGAVLNESMNSGCAVICNEAIGSAKCLIDDKENGMLYKTKRQLINIVEKLVINRVEIQRLGFNAYDTIINEWSPKIVTHRFLQICKELLTESQTTDYNGAMSRI